MKTIFTYDLILILFLLLFINTAIFQEEKFILDQKATIKLLVEEPELFVIIPDSLSDYRFLPDSIPDQFKFDGCRIVFSGIIGEIPENQRLPGTPLTITKIDFEK